MDAERGPMWWVDCVGKWCLALCPVLLAAHVGARDGFDEPEQSVLVTLLTLGSAVLVAFPRLEAQRAMATLFVAAAILAGVATALGPPPLGVASWGWVHGAAVGWGCAFLLFVAALLEFSWRWRIVTVAIFVLGFHDIDSGFVPAEATSWMTLSIVGLRVLARQSKGLVWLAGVPLAVAVGGGGQEHIYASSGMNPTWGSLQEFNAGELRRLELFDQGMTASMAVLVAALVSSWLGHRGRQRIDLWRQLLPAPAMVGALGLVGISQDAHARAWSRHAAPRFRADAPVFDSWRWGAARVAGPRVHLTKDGAYVESEHLFGEREPRRSVADPGLSAAVLYHREQLLSWHLRPQGVVVVASRDTPMERVFDLLPRLRRAGVRRIWLSYLVPRPTPLAWTLSETPLHERHLRLALGPPPGFDACAPAPWNVFEDNTSGAQGTGDEAERRDLTAPLSMHYVDFVERATRAYDRRATTGVLVDPRSWQPCPNVRAAGLTR